MKNFHSGMGNPEELLSEHQEWLARKADRDRVVLRKSSAGIVLEVRLMGISDPLALLEKMDKLETLKERIHAIADAL